MNAKGPMRKEGVLSRKLGDEWLLYNPEKGAVHIINSTAECVWGLCDGTHDLDEIARYLQDTYEVPDGTPLRKEVDDVIRAFSDQGLLHSRGN